MRIRVRSTGADAHVSGREPGDAEGAASERAAMSDVGQASGWDSETFSVAIDQQKIAIQDVSMTFRSRDGGEVLAIKSVSCDIKRGEFVALIGPSGGGKTTLLNLIAGIHRPNSGRVLVDGQPVTGLNPNLSYMPSRDALLPWRTVLRNVEYGLELRGVGKEERRDTAISMLRLVGLEDAVDRYPSQLSSGMRQRTAVARTFATRPDVLLMDEPFSALDAQTRVKVQDVFLNLWEATRSTVLLVTHDIGEAIALADRIIVFAPGPATVRDEIVVPIERPRTLRRILGDPAYHELFVRLLNELDDSSTIEGMGT